MQKKIDEAQHLLQNCVDKFRCPTCHEAIGLTGYSLICLKGHQFDLSKKGTVYFLSHGIQTEYNAKMLQPRGRLIQQGLYQPVLAHIFSILKGGTTVDVGCGEGSFLADLTKRGLEGVKIGFDISKEGVYLATNHQINAFWCVADLTNLPFRTKSIDTILNIFSPSQYKEFKRVLKEEGTVIKVIPETYYLHELRMAFYPDDLNKQHYSNEKVVEKFSKELDIIHNERVTYTFSIPKKYQLDLLEMSPLEWNVSENVKSYLQQKPLENITIDVRIVQGKTK